jgi:crotonobetainyl-CoA:carnitine CoA-transferase CaiB-like acyl-CoA transferase
MALAWKTEEGRSVLLRLLENTDVLIEQFRPGYLSRFGLDPADLCKQFPRLLLMSLTGFGQKNAQSRKAGHDLNYQAVSGVLSQMQTQDGRLQVPGVQIADIAGGSYGLVTAVMAGLLERGRTGKGGHYPLSMADALYPLSVIRSGLLQGGMTAPSWNSELGGGLPNYRTYRTADGRWMAVGSLEPKFALPMLNALGIEADLQKMYTDEEEQVRIQKKLTETFAKKSRDEWEGFFSDKDWCVSPVFDVEEAPESGFLSPGADAYIQTKEGFKLKSPVQPFVRPDSFSPAPGYVAELGENSKTILEEAGYKAEEIEELLGKKVVFINS